MKVVIFLGPSLPLAEAREVLPEAVFLPPAKQADLLSAVGIQRPDVIGLIDGEFGQSLSVWHKEMLYALERGIRVFGASSMGALRAAETAAFGCVGVGRVFEMYANGTLTDDDEVALAHGIGDAGYRSFSEPMVNLRATFAQAREQALVTSDVHDRLVATAKALFFPERTFPRIFRDAVAAGVPQATVDSLAEFIKNGGYVDLKRADALLLLRTIRALPPDGERPQPSFEFNRSRLFEALYNRDRRVRHEGFEVPLASIANWSALHLPQFNELNAQALNRALVMLLADVLEVKVTDAEVDAEIERFRRARRLLEDEALEAWRLRNDLEPGEFRELMTQLAVCRRLHRWLIASRSMERTTRLVLDELRLRGQYESAAAAAAQQEHIVEEQHPDFRESGFRDLSLQHLIVDHLRATPWRPDVHYRIWSEEAGFHTLNDLHVELLRARLARHYSEGMASQLIGTLDAGLDGTP